MKVPKIRAAVMMWFLLSNTAGISFSSSEAAIQNMHSFFHSYSHAFQNRPPTFTNRSVLVEIFRD